MKNLMQNKVHNLNNQNIVQQETRWKKRKKCGLIRRKNNNTPRHPMPQKKKNPIPFSFSTISYWTISTIPHAPSQRKRW